MTMQTAPTNQRPHVVPPSGTAPRRTATRRMAARVALGALTCTLAACQAPAPPDWASLEPSVGKVICVIDGPQDIPIPVGSGSGFLVSRTHVVTNAHVVRPEVHSEKARELAAELPGGGPLCGRMVVAFSDQDWGYATLKQFDDTIDLALLELDQPRDAEPLTLLDNERTVAKGDDVAALGFPRIGEFRDTAKGLVPLTAYLKQSGVMTHKLTMGKLVATQEDSERRNVALIGSAISGGNSGGPVFDGCQRVMGVATFVVHDEAAKAGYAVGVSEILPFLKQAGVKPVVSSGRCGADSSTPGVWLGLGGLLFVSLGFVGWRWRQWRAAGPPPPMPGPMPPMPLLPDIAGADSTRRKGRWSAEFETGPLRGQRLANIQGTLVVGRDKHSCQLVLPKDTFGVSRRHAELRLTSAGGLTVTDLDSTEGTYVAGRRLQPNRPEPVKSGAIIQFGTEDITLKVTQR